MIQVYTYYSWKDWIVFSLISNWLMLLAWWGLHAAVVGFKHQAAICIMGGNFSRCIHFVPLSSPDFLIFFVILVEVNTCMVLCWAISFF